MAKRRGLLAGLVAAPWIARAAGRIPAVGIESQYADVIAAIGGDRVEVAAIETNPNADPHGFEASPAVARRIAAARLVVLNGLGYDSWARRIIRATAGSARGRHVIAAQDVLGLPDATRNPHIWYDPAAMPKVAAAIAQALAAIDPAGAAVYRRNLAAFEASLAPWRAAIGAFRAQHAGIRAAVTEPVGNDLFRAMGIAVATPWSLQAAVMNGTDPAPQDIAVQEKLLRRREVSFLGYNRQVIGPLTRAMLDAARAAQVPVVALYETMPAGFHFGGWMLAETAAVTGAVAHGTSTSALVAGEVRGAR
ncbi:MULTISPECIES: metal ABC transporter solute-binding protein, Zn/Mn family [Acidiphilium]|jgi:zinc/manganese transport system substrate-binding protein|uniref:metal ABC transporter solute-binding protein, Zn/Mn family n=1 Tax=Acidiphilium TaxID=522 RepID=UPI001F4BDDA9|nr:MULTISPECIES: zinc ABC transporter substrate-binding protein [Acidiphilium]UNC14001.1 cation ABC transporter substrate-binding protein [Acidiphilium multivorum]